MRKLGLIITLLLIVYPLLGQTPNPILRIALTYLNTPYVAHTLERTRNEKLIVNTKEVDCTTFVEYVLAEALATSDTTKLHSAKEYLQQIRYRDGVIEDYTSRLHYITEWIIEGEKNNFVTDITNTYGTDSMYVTLSYMSKHPQYYRHLAHSKSNQAKMQKIEQRVSGTRIGWLPKEQLPSEGLSWIKDGDIIALTVGIRGLDVSHLGFAYYKNEKLHLLHASSSVGKVIIEPIPLSEMLSNNKNWNGLRVVRPSICNPTEKELSPLEVVQKHFTKLVFQN